MLSSRRSPRATDRARPPVSVGFYDRGALTFAGKVGAGFTPHLRRDTASRLRTCTFRSLPVADLPSSRTSHRGGGVTAEQTAEMQWVRPSLVAQIRFVEWTADADGHLRHPAFLAFREDTRAKDVRRE